MTEKWDNAFEKFEKMTIAQRREFLERCPECGSINFRQIEGEVVCTSCGVVRSRPLQHLENPTSDYNSQGNPVTNLAFGKNLGGTLGTRPHYGRIDLKEVLANAHAGREDIDLRARFMNIMSTQNEHPIIHRLLEQGSKLSHEFWMDGEDAWLFADYLGKLLRKVGYSASLLLNPKTESLRTKKLAVATFVYVFQLMERDRGLRKQIEYEPFFPGNRKTVPPKIPPSKYKVDKQFWVFVNFEVNRKALRAEHQRLKRPLQTEEEMTAAVKAAVNKLRLNGDLDVLSSEFLVDGQRELKRCKPKYMKVTMSRENLTEYEKKLLAVFDDAPPTVMSKSAVETNVCSFVARKSLREGTLATVLNAISSLVQSAEVEVTEQQVRAVIDRLDLNLLPSKSAKKGRRREGNHRYDLYAFLVSILKIKAGLTSDLFIRSVTLKRLLEAYKDPARLQEMPWATRHPYSIVTKILEQLPLTLKSS